MTRCSCRPKHTENFKLSNNKSSRVTSVCIGYNRQQLFIYPDYSLNLCPGLWFHATGSWFKQSLRFLAFPRAFFSLFVCDCWREFWSVGESCLSALCYNLKTLFVSELTSELGATVGPRPQQRGELIKVLFLSPEAPIKLLISR